MIRGMDLIKIPEKWKFCQFIAVTSLLGICWASGQTSNLKQTLFARINVPSTILQTAGTKEEFPIFSRFACLQQALQRHWCHMASFGVNGMCSLYDFSLPSHYWSLDGDPTGLIECYTDIYEGCVNGNQYYLEGESLEYMNATCINKTWVTADGGMVLQDIPSNCALLIGVGCIFIDILPRPYIYGNQYCQSLGAQLVMPNDVEGFEALRQYFLYLNTGRHYRVGIYHNKWLDGRDVNTSLWVPGEPSNSTQCGMLWVHSNYMLADYFCEFGFYSICQLYFQV